MCCNHYVLIKVMPAAIYLFSIYFLHDVTKPICRNITRKLFKRIIIYIPGIDIDKRASVRVYLSSNRFLFLYFYSRFLEVLINLSGTPINIIFFPFKNIYHTGLFVIKLIAILIILSAIKCIFKKGQT